MQSLGGLLLAVSRIIFFCQPQAGSYTQPSSFKASPAFQIFVM
jgi:hypothetical protein